MKNSFEIPVTHFTQVENNPGPLWGYGSSSIVRQDNNVYCTVMKVDTNSNSMCNMKWNLLMLSEGTNKWEKIISGSHYSEREPCPLGRLSENELIISINPCKDVRYITPENKSAHFCTPKLVLLDCTSMAMKEITPEWSQPYEFTEHSYRGMATDSNENSSLLFQVVGYHGLAWTYLDHQFSSKANGFLSFPSRATFPQVAIRGKSAAILAVSDVYEPNIEWREYKKQVTGKEWDYDFRQLFFSYTPDISCIPFSPITTLASQDETCGHMRNMDLYIDGDGISHIVWIDRNIWHGFIREMFFKDIQIIIRLNYCRVKNGKVIFRKTILESREILGQNKKNSALMMSGAVPNYAAFHVSDSNKLFLVYHISSNLEDIKSGNYIQQVFPEYCDSNKILDLDFPLASFFTANFRLGNAPSKIIDLYGTTSGWEYDDLSRRRTDKWIRYAQVRLGECYE